MKTIFKNSWLKSLAIMAVGLSCLLTSGCGGCRDDGVAKTDAQKTEAQKKKEEEEKKKKKPKPDFETRTPVLLPGNFPKPKSKDDKESDKKDPLGNALSKIDNSVMRFNRAKLGHWVSANFQVIANNYNSDGQLSTSSIDASGNWVPVQATDYFLSSTRPVSLPKGEWKNLETTVYLPKRLDTRVANPNVRYVLQRANSGLPHVSVSQPTTGMKPFQQHIVLLSSRPDTFAFLKMTDCFHLRNQQMGNGEMVPPFYYLVASESESPIPLPRNVLNCTTIAYLIWDDYDPDLLSQDHQEAILDWIHFGGQLILSGPDCLDKLQNSFLGSYLPAQFEGSRNITNADVKELNRHWAVPVQKNPADQRDLVVSDSVPLLGVSFKPHVDAKFVDGTGEIAIERRVGRGRIVLTAFSINAPVIKKWRSFASFFNNVLLRKPSRKFGKTTSSDNSFGWEDDGTSIFDPLMSTTLRFLSRDLSLSGTPETPQYSLEEDAGQELMGMGNGGPYVGIGPAWSNEDLLAQNSLEIRRSKKLASRNVEDTLHFGGYEDAQQAGPCGWNDESGVSIAARETLKEAAGITPPSSSFVLKMLAAYLIVLVPINWLIFRLMGRVEWAWAAAPLIAIVGAVAVVKMASLDIGFVRSNTQIGLLEIHAQYPRAHATEYSALYTSLSTRYNVDLDNPTAQSLPFATESPATFEHAEGALNQVRLHRTVQNRLEGFQIQSNSTGLLHTEFMLDLEGIVSATFDGQNKDGQNKDGKQVEDQNFLKSISNGSFLDLSHVGVIHRDAAGDYHAAWVGDLSAGGSADDLKFEKMSAEKAVDQWRSVELFASPGRVANQIWEEHFDNAMSAELNALTKIPQLAKNWDVYLPLFLRVLAVRDESVVTRPQFVQVYRSVNTAATARIGRLFDTITGSLAMGLGESRLIATTDQRLGRTRFDPDATQTDQQTLVLVHLKQPPLPPAKRDANALSDFTGKSSLDWENEMKDLEDLFEESSP